MPCLGGVDPEDFVSGVVDPTEDPDPLLPEITIDDVNAVKDPDGSWWARFPINVTNINFQDVIQFNYATANGTGTSGTNYISASGIFSIPVGEAGGVIEVGVLAPTGATGQKTFFLNLSSPSNCTLADTQGKATIDYGDGGGPPPPDPDPIDQAVYTGFPKQSCNSSSDTCTIYDEFVCGYKSACTAFAGAAAMSGLYYRKTTSFQRFDAKKLFDDTFHADCGCSSCGSYSPSKVLRHMRDVGVKMVGSSTVKTISSYTAISDTTNAGLVRKLKRAIVDTGVAYFASIFYSSPDNGWNRCLDCNDNILRNPTWSGPYTDCASWHSGNLVNSGLGHAWILTGWNDNKGGQGGAFEVQSSHGSDWGLGGRCWIPYSYLKLTSAWNYWKLVYGG